MYDPAADEAGSVAAPKKKKFVESKTDRFLVEFFISYDIRGLSKNEQNAPAPDTPLTTADVKDMKFAVDLAVGRKLELMPTVAAGAAATSAPRECAAVVLPFAKRVIVDVGQLCKPLWAFPWLKDFDTAKEFFKDKVTSC
jgi:hypothetical protein